MPSSMRQWVLTAPGSEHLQLQSIHTPQPGPNQVLVRVAAVSLNYRDKLAIDLTTAFPFVPASDMAGQVVAVGPGSTRWQVGDRVISQFVPHWTDGRHPGGGERLHQTLGGSLPGVLAEYIALPQDWLVAAPATLDDAHASTLPVAGLTAWYALVELGGLRAGQTVLVQGTGGVALFAIQLAHAHGAEVLVTSSSPEKLQRAAALGARHLIDRHREDWATAALGITGGQGVDHVLEIAGGANLGESAKVVTGFGRISLIGVLAGLEISSPAHYLLTKNVTVQAIGTGPQRALEALVRAVDAIGLKPVIDSRHRFEDLPQALARLDAGPFGKIVIDVAQATSGA